MYARLTNTRAGAFMESMKISVLMEDYCPKGGFRGEHGLSLFVETGSATILLDTGQGDSFLHNARAMGIDLSRVDAVVLSHAHYDHGGGLEALYAAFLAAGVPTLPPLYAGAGYRRRKYSRTGPVVKDIGVPPGALPGPANTGVPAAVEVDSAYELASGVWLLAMAPVTDGTVPDGRFRLSGGTAGEATGGVPELVDTFDDEVSLVIDGPDGLVVVTGCAHRGIVNIVADALRRFPGCSLAAVAGGFHLSDAPDSAIDRIADAIDSFAPARMLPCHCTGPRAFAALYGRHPDRVTWLSCCSTVEL